MVKILCNKKTSAIFAEVFLLKQYLKAILKVHLLEMIYSTVIVLLKK